MSNTGASSSTRRHRPLRLRVHSVLRWLHVYISMGCMLLVLFFSLTGVTLNHPDWLANESTREAAGHLPAGWETESRAIDWLTVAEYLRRTHGVRGTVTERRAEGGQGTLTFRGPGYSADCFINIADGSYHLTTTYQGALGVLNDLHRGRDTGATWGWVIDAAGMLLVALSVTGLGLLWYLRKMRVSALVTLAGGCALFLLLTRHVS